MSVCGKPVACYDAATGLNSQEPCGLLQDHKACCRPASLVCPARHDALRTARAPRFPLRLRLAELVDAGARAVDRSAWRISDRLRGSL